MNAELKLPRHSPLSTIIAAALAAFMAIGLFTAIAQLFRNDGVPMGRLVAAERACTQHKQIYVSEREACMRDWLAAARATNVASK